MTTKAQHIARLESRNYEWAIPWEVVAMMAEREGCSLKAYLCPAKIWTIGWGETEGVEPGMVWTEKQCDDRFVAEVAAYTKRVEAMLTQYANPNQLGAMVSLAYNIGLGGAKTKKGFYASSVRRLHNAGDYAAASRAFSLFNKARVNGVLTELPGLVARRAMESALYLKPDADAPEDTPTQAVEQESNVIRSPISVNSTATVVAGAATIAGSMLETVTPTLTQARQIANDLNIDPLLVLGAVLLGVGISSLYWRFKQRNDGWA